MYLGIVGHEAAKFTPETEALARKAIVELISKHDPNGVISGACPLGGIDIWAIEEARRLGIQTREFAPKVRQWEPSNGAYGFKARNLDIARESHHVACIVVATLPSTYTGMRFQQGCYHCRRHGQETPHIKSGGCWTAWKAKSREWVILP